MFGMIRVIFWGIIFILCFILIQNSKIVYKRQWYLISFVIIVILTTLSALIPIENAFITFSSPESAFNYVYTDDVKLVVEGTDTDFVIGRNNNSDVYSIIPKSDNGWKLGMGLDIKKIIHKISDEMTICIYQYKDTDDYYITILDTCGNIHEITDNHNSEFYHLDNERISLNKIFRTYYAYILTFDNQYYLIVNGKTLLLTDKQG